MLVLHLLRLRDRSLTSDRNSYTFINALALPEMLTTIRYTPSQLTISSTSFDEQQHGIVCLAPGLGHIDLTAWWS